MNSQEEMDSWFRKFFTIWAGYTVVATVLSVATLAGIAWVVYQVMQHFGVV